MVRTVQIAGFLVLLRAVITLSLSLWFFIIKMQSPVRPKARRACARTIRGSIDKLPSCREKLKCDFFLFPSPALLYRRLVKNYKAHNEAVYIYIYR